jgi:hypothetical protein
MHPQTNNSVHRGKQRQVKLACCDSQYLPAPDGLTALDQQLVKPQTASPLRKQHDFRLVQRANATCRSPGKPDIVTATQFHGRIDRF